MYEVIIIKSYWIDSVNYKNFDSIKRDINTDVVIIGGGITGISTAYKLSKHGFNVCILEKDKIAHHATGNTTAKITSQHGLFYNYLVNSFSKDFAKGYLEANESAILDIKHIIDKEHISCDLENMDNYVYTDVEDEVSKIKDEVSCVNSLGLNAQFVDTIDIPVKCLGAIKFPNQAQFNPLKYVYGLCDVIIKNNGQIYENSKVYDVKKEDDSYITYTDSYKVKSKYVVLASHYPIINVPGFYFLKMYQETSYLIALKTSLPLFDGMYINTKSPISSFRTAVYGDDRLVLIGGSEHKVGTNEDLSNSYLNLENFAKSIYPDANILYRWHTQDCISLDKIPYIGDFSTIMPNMYVATGFKKWGMTTSNVASNIICDKILGKSNPYEKIFLSTRFKPIKNGTEFVDMLKQVSTSLIVDKFKIPKETLAKINNGEGKVIELDGTKLGIYKDEDGKLFALKPVCTHLGCEFSFNNLQKTWDCPCHGSRFSYDGKSLYSPSIKDIPLIDLE